MYNLIFNFLIVALFSTLLSACSIYSKKQCESFDWNQRGYLSALKGKTQGLGLAHYYRECSERHEVLPNDQQFQAGYSRGLKAFCTPEYAEKFGYQGGEYVGICSDEQEKVILKPYVKGINVFYKKRVAELESEVSDLESQVSSLKHEKSSLESEVSSLKSEVNSCQANSSSF